jgi:hypothetical protein
MKAQGLLFNYDATFGAEKTATRRHQESVSQAAESS